MIKIELPELECLEKIRVRLDEPRIISFKDERESSQKTIIPTEIVNHKNRKGIYLILNKDNKILYIGQTTNLEIRMRMHFILKRDSDIKYIYFLEENDRDNRLLFELIYKYHYLKKGKIERR